MYLYTQQRKHCLQLHQGILNTESKQLDSRFARRKHSKAGARALNEIQVELQENCSQLFESQLLLI